MKSAIIGAGTYGSVYYSYLTNAGIKIVAFLDDNKNLHGSMVSGIPVIGGSELFPVLQKEYGIEAVYCPIGNNKIRVKILENANSYGLKTPNFIDASVKISNDAVIGNGVYIIAGATIMPYAVLDDYVMISMSANIAHHSHLKKGTFISTGVNFGASITAEEYSYIGIGATIMTGVKKLGKNCKVGAGAVVIRDIDDNTVVAGVPAKVLKKNSD